MLATAKISIIDTKAPQRYKVTYSKRMNSKNEYEQIVAKVPTYFCEVGEKLGVISSSLYVGGDKVGIKFFIVINKRNVVFTLDENDLTLPDGYIEKPYNLVTKTIEHKYQDFVPSKIKKDEKLSFDFGFNF